MSELPAEAIRDKVRERYGRIGAPPEVAPGGETPAASCCGDGSASGCCGSGSGNTCCQSTSDAASIGYSVEDLAYLPSGSNLGLGCGNPTGLLSIVPGETVLDLGSGAGIDCFLAAKRVGPSGRVIGVDMTPEMLARARSNAVRANATNVEFRLGEIEHLPVADQSVDVAISNCVINLVPDKSQVYREIHRVLRPGGRLAVSDVVATRPIPEEARHDLAQWSGCSSGAMYQGDILALLESCGFEEVVVQLATGGQPVPRSLEAQDALGVVSASIRARRPIRG
jgi:arsenite methyltransferase